MPPRQEFVPALRREAEPVSMGMNALEERCHRSRIGRGRNEKETSDDCCIQRKGIRDCEGKNGSRKNRRTLLHYNIGGQLQLQLREGEGELPVLKCVNRLAPDGFKEGRCRSHTRHRGTTHWRWVTPCPLPCPLLAVKLA